VKIGIITLFPEMFDILGCGGVTARALKSGIVNLSTWNPRDFTQNKHRRVDDRPYGGGPGMVMQIQPLRLAIKTAIETLGEKTRIVYLSPQGKPLSQAGVQKFAALSSLLLVAGRYEGIDERLLIQDIDEECSIGDYVLSGGELAAMVLIDAITRLLPESLGCAESATTDSFYNGLLDHPHYTRPEMIDGQTVPEVLLTGNHATIARWRKKQSLGRTWCKRPDLLEKLDLTIEQQILLNEFIDEYKTGKLK